ncbi:hypothetical protein C6P41_002146 [Kluyveromyces marxianus]|nr:hypothetical protein C6P41_002146 [Kluyveromyces marxianus]
MHAGDSSVTATMSMAMSSASATGMSSMSGMSGMSGMSMSGTATSAMAMSMSSSATASATGMSGMSGMSSGDSMPGMNSYLTRKYMNYPVLFKHLNASNRGQAFGIFVLIVAVAFVYKALLFLSWYLELEWFKRSTTPEDQDVDEATGKKIAYTVQDLELQKQFLPTSFSKFMFNVFAPNWIDFLHDLVRLLITFASTMLIYMLMLVAMTYVLTYIFAVILGLSLAEIFFNRVKINLLKARELKKEWERRFKLCQCAPAPNAGSSYEDDDAQSSTTSKATLDGTEKNRNSTSKAPKVGCCCGSDEDPQEEAERNIRSIATQKEQAGNMNVDLLPADNVI